MLTRIRVNIMESLVIIKLTLKRVIFDDPKGNTMQYSELYVARIRSLCKDRHISINKLASMSGVKQSTLDNIVRGLTKNPHAKTLHKIAIAFNMTLSEFLDFPELNAYSFEDDTEEE